MTHDADACSFTRGFEIVKPQAHPQQPNFHPPAPRVSVKSVKRGYDDGNFGSCSDARIIEIVTEDDAHFEVLGYTFAVVEGGFPDDVFPDAVLAPIDFKKVGRGFRFV